jgi:hypothetical protein
MSLIRKNVGCLANYFIADSTISLKFDNVLIKSKDKNPWKAWTFLQTCPLELLYIKPY